MTLFEILHKLILGPIELLFDVVFSFSMQFLGSPVLSIVILSLAINLLVLPLYKKADDLQREEQEISKRLKPRIDQIREAFTGDERFMMLQTYYRQNNYKPYYVLRGSLSLLLQIPFFMAAYNFLSGLSVLQGVSFGPIPDLAAPDGILKIGGMAVNVLPILMTLINIVSGMIYTRGMPLKSKVQLYGMALVFLVLLYNSPAGLVFYWTLNNLFSLGLNILTRLPNRMKILRFSASLAGFAAGAAAVICREELGNRMSQYLLCAAVLMQLPAAVHWLGKKLNKNGRPAKRERRSSFRAEKRRRTVFFACCMLLTVLTGMLIPSAVIHDSPEEFVEINAFRSPLVYVLHALLLAAGTFMVWSVIFYLLSENRRQQVFSLVFAFLALGAVTDYMFFGNGYGNMSPTLVYDTGVAQSIRVSEKLLNTGALALLFAAVWFLWKKRPGILRVGCLTTLLVVTGMSLGNIVSVGGEIPEIQELAAQRSADREKVIHLDKKGKNVVVMMLDRAVGLFSPFIFEEKPELKDQFSGFTCFLNTISYGKGTHTGSPALFGGYEYTPQKLLERRDRSMLEKQNEALRLMPLVFLENGYEVTVCDPPLSNYSAFPDLSIYEDVPEIRAFVTEGAYEGSSGDESSEGILERERVRERNFFCYSIFRASPVLLHSKLYEGGNYNKTDRELHDFISYDTYRVLEKMPDMTLVQSEGADTFLMFTNNLTHEPQILQEPEYVPAENVDNRQYDREHPSRFSADGRELVLSSGKQKTHYHVNMAAMLLVGKWLDFLREQGVYNNTRIIIVADHGVSLGYTEMWSEWMPQDTAAFWPLLMFKDFGSHGAFTFSDTFMTNADTPSLAFRGLVDRPVNPATGVPVTDRDKQNEEQLICNIAADNDFEADENSFFDDSDTTYPYFALKNQDRTDLQNWSIAQ